MIIFVFEYVVTYIFTKYNYLKSVQQWKLPPKFSVIFLKRLKN